MDLLGQTIVITGANTGLGRAAALQLGARGAHLVLACRSRAKTEPVLAEVAARGGRAEFLALELGDLAAVRAAAAELIGRGTAIHALVNNAGLGGQHGLTRDGFELAFGVNHVGTYLWTRLLLPQVVVPRARASAPARIVFVASERHRMIERVDWDAFRAPTRSRLGLHEYGASKLAMLLFQRALTRRLDAALVTTHALNPGRVATEVTRDLPRVARWILARTLRTPDNGARFVVEATVAGGATSGTGGYTDVGRAKPVSQLAADDALAELMWRRTADWVGLDAEL